MLFMAISHYQTHSPAIQYMDIFWNCFLDVTNYILDVTIFHCNITDCYIMDIFHLIIDLLAQPVHVQWRMSTNVYREREITLYLLEIAIYYSTELGFGDIVCSGKYT